MTTKTIQINNQSDDFVNALSLAEKTAADGGLDARQTIQLRIITEEMIGLVHSVTGELKAAFWIECDNKDYALHLTTQTAMTAEKRASLIASASSGRNDAATTFLGKLRNMLESALAPSENRTRNDIPADILNKLTSHVVLSEEDIAQMNNNIVEIPKWDGYEKSILQSVADQVKIAIRGDFVDICVTKAFK